MLAISPSVELGAQ
ncbi:hypothetical protein ANOM_011881 [Aspergillus nomiae NRRL 13137]|uniref:Uncharacterized protein n=1 Tax=Aspergillus nomiae NRRL (strain ATCC 15546 / NRRL 13137 / CBS 260.88 / M93) TaxID=1509407 RepID=A0A0L1IJZ3_ASPN3|nr:hypothetical protein ANOM_011881 [Aspergillus nomiae NRRL 13137]